MHTFIWSMYLHICKYVYMYCIMYIHVYIRMMNFRLKYFYLQECANMATLVTVFIRNRENKIFTLSLGNAYSETLKFHNMKSENWHEIHMYQFYYFRFRIILLEFQNPFYIYIKKNCVIKRT